MNNASDDMFDDAVAVNVLASRMLYDFVHVFMASSEERAEFEWWIDHPDDEVRAVRVRSLHIVIETHRQPGGSYDLGRLACLRLVRAGQ